MIERLLGRILVHPVPALHGPWISSLGEFPSVKNHVTVCCCPRCGERFPRLPPDQAARESAERQRNFSQNGVRVKNIAAKRSGDHNGVKQGWQ